MTEARTVKVSLDATVRRGFGRDAHYTATYFGLVNASAPTMGEARAQLADNLHAYISNATARPAFARDDDGALIVAVPEGSGTSVYRITDAGARCTALREGTPEQAIAAVPHYTPIS